MLTKIPRSKNVVRVSLWLAILNLIAWGCGSALRGFGVGVPARPFDARVWAQSSPKGWRMQERLAMYGDLTASYLRYRMPCAQVIALLGPPDQTHGSTLRYALGYGIHYKRYLVLKFNDGGQLEFFETYMAP